MATTIVLRADHEVICGDSFSFAVVTDASLVGVDLRCTVKSRVADADAGALSVVESGDGIALDVGDNMRAIVSFEPADTGSWPAGSDLHIDVQAVLTGGVVRTLSRGMVRTQQRVTLTRGASVNPREIYGARLAYWLRPEDYVPANGTWPDVTGNLTLTSSAANTRPTTGTINGRLSVYSDGVDDNLSGTLVSSIPVGARPRTFVVAHQIDNDPLIVFPMIFSDNSWFVAGIDSVLFPEETHAAQLRQPDPAASYFFEQPRSYAPALYESSFSADSAKRMFVNGIAATLNPVTAAPGWALANAVTTVWLADFGAGWDSFKGHFGDVFCVRDQPTDEEVALTYAWLSSRWGLSLP